MQALFFVYGSLVNTRVLFKRDLRFNDVSVEIVSSGIHLPDFDVRFSRFSQARGGGVLDISYEPGCRVPGILMNLKDPVLMEALDVREGVAANSYQRIRVTVLDEYGRQYLAYTYQVVIPEPYFAPTEEYLTEVVEGLAFYGIDNRHVLRAAENLLPACPIKPGL